ncbi:MAG TPA: putative glycolipid-binding domain-containing protein [Pyrinomonadaceae bacterium]|nr:putative glycolipid-binding domain-containing protein [Pyrinomonadaceae bacterium]
MNNASIRWRRLDSRSMKQPAFLSCRFVAFYGGRLSSPHVYRRMDETTYRYESNGGEFVTELTVNKTSFVINYPNFWTTEDPRAFT